MASDSFTEASPPVALETHDANWAGMGGDFVVTSLSCLAGGIVGHEGAWQHSGARYTASTEDFSQIVFKAGVSGTVRRMVAVRASASSRGYQFGFGAITTGNYTRCSLYRNATWLNQTNGAYGAVTIDHLMEIAATTAGDSHVDVSGFANGAGSADVTYHDSGGSQIANGNPGFCSADDIEAVAESHYDDWTDGAGGGTAYARSIFDSVGVTDATARIAGFVWSVADNEGVTDVACRAAIFGRAIADAEGLTDFSGRAAVYARIAADTEGVTDAATKAASFVRVPSDSEGVLDSLARAVDYVRSIHDPEGVTDAVARVYDAIRAVAESVGITDAATVEKFIQEFLAVYYIALRRNRE